MKTVLCHGCFDVLHIGHIMHLRAAAALGDRLVVSITASPYIRKEGRPIFNDNERAYALAALRSVDQVYTCYARTGVNAILYIRPDIYVKGMDYISIGLNELERAACNEVGAKIIFTSTEKYSSTDVIRRAFK